MAKICFIFLLLLVASFFEAAAGNSCSWGNFRCSNSSTCRPSQDRCNGYITCPNGEDEQVCPNACLLSRFEFRCNNNECIPRRFLCDGSDDCKDNSDESNFLCGVRSSAIRCYYCSSSAGRCNAMTCPYNQRYCYRKTADRSIGGSTSRVTVGGCRTTCTSSERASACRNQMNCQMSCCRSSLCNSGSSSVGSSLPSCYACRSTSSYKDCENKATRTSCLSASAFCYKMDYKISSSNASVYKEGCTTSCSQLRSTYCSSSVRYKCKMHCCTGSDCNAGSIQRFSIVVLVTCAVAFLVLG